MEYGRAAAVLHDVFTHRAADVIRRRVERLVARGLVAHALYQIADRYPRIGHRIGLRVREDIHQRDQPAVTPADYADPLGVQERVVFQHPLAGQVDVVHLPPTVINLLVETTAIARTAAVIRRDDRVALLQHLAKD